MRLAFVLLPLLPLLDEDTELDGEAIVREHRRLFPEATAPALEPSEPSRCTMKLGSDALVIAEIPAPIPNGEAEAAARFSIAAYGPAPYGATHGAHLAVVYQTAEERPTLGSLQRFTRALAAIVAATEAVGVYWGDSGATHPGKLFVEVASDRAVEMPLFLWTGLSVAPAGDDTTSILSVGMWPQLKLPDLELVAPTASANRALAFFFDLLAYVVRRGDVPTDGETIGRTPDEKWVVKHGRSAIDPERPTWRVVLPDDFVG